MKEDLLWLSGGALLGAALFALSLAADLFRRDNAQVRSKAPRGRSPDPPASSTP
jgi:hypothetical protein